MTGKVAIPTPEVNAETTATLDMPTGISGAVHDMSMISMFMEADFVVKFVILLLLFSSFWSWTIIFDKWYRFWLLKKKTDEFEEEFWSGDLLEKLYDRIKHTADHPMAKVFVSGMFERLRSRKKTKPKKSTSSANLTLNVDYSLKIGLKERVFQAMNLARNRELGKLEKNLSFLATVGSTAPFVGLFGTVWGIMDSFQSIAMTKNTSLAVVAPGIAEALFATAVGLFAAIPAVIFYNKFTNNLNSFSDRLDEFSEEFGAIVSRELDEG